MSDYQYFDEDGKLHREDGPAIGNFLYEAWYKHGVLHREAGPAYIDYRYKYEVWQINGQRHREDGPAVLFANNKNEWWLNGKKLSCQSQEEFEQLMRFKAYW